VQYLIPGKGEKPQNCPLSNLNNGVCVGAARILPVKRLTAMGLYIYFLFVDTDKISSM